MHQNTVFSLLPQILEATTSLTQGVARPDPQPPRWRDRPAVDVHERESVHHQSALYDLERLTKPSGQSLEEQKQLTPGKRSQAQLFEQSDSAY